MMTMDDGNASGNTKNEIDVNFLEEIVMNQHPNGVNCVIPHYLVVKWLHFAASKCKLETDHSSSESELTQP